MAQAVRVLNEVVQHHECGLVDQAAHKSRLHVAAAVRPLATCCVHGSLPRQRNARGIQTGTALKRIAQGEHQLRSLRLVAWAPLLSRCFDHSQLSTAPRCCCVVRPTIRSTRSPCALSHALASSYETSINIPSCDLPSAFIATSRITADERVLR